MEVKNNIDVYEKIDDAMINSIEKILINRLQKIVYSRPIEQIDPRFQRKIYNLFESRYNIIE